MTQAQQIIWHLGPQKTGTTSIQNMLISNHDTLAPWLYSRTIADLPPKFVKSLWHQVVAGDTSPSPRTQRLFRSVLNDWVASGAPTLVLSNETFVGAKFTIEGLSTQERLSRIVPILDGLSQGYATTFVVYTRPLKKWYRSAYKWAVYDQVEKRGLEDWLVELANAPSWRQTKASMMASTQGDVIFTDMAREAKASEIGLGDCILDAAHVPKDVISLLKISPKHNESIPDGATIFQRDMNRTFGRMSERLAVQGVIQANPNAFADHLEL